MIYPSCMLVYCYITYLIFLNWWEKTISLHHKKYYKTNKLETQILLPKSLSINANKAQSLVTSTPKLVEINLGSNNDFEDEKLLIVWYKDEQMSHYKC